MANKRKEELYGRRNQPENTALGTAAYAAGRRGADHNEDLHPELAVPVENPSQPLAVIPGDYTIGQGAETAYGKAADRAINTALGYDTPATQATAPKVSEDYLNEYLSRGPFKYDVNSDALYQQYKNQYMRQGNLAMRDTIGQASALTGGYGNSYAESAGQAAYNQYLGALNDKIPELYQLAYDRYDREGQQLRDAYELLYGRERDAVADQQWQAQFDEGVRQFNENMAFNKEQFAEGIRQYNQNYELQVRAADLNERIANHDMSLQDAELELKKALQDHQITMDEMEYTLAMLKYQEDVRANKANEDYKNRALKQESDQFNSEMGYKYASMQNSNEQAAMDRALSYYKTDNSTSSKTSGSKSSGVDSDEDAANVLRDIDYKKLGGYDSYTEFKNDLDKMCGGKNVSAATYNSRLQQWLDGMSNYLSDDEIAAIWWVYQKEEKTPKRISAEVQ